MQTAEHRPCKSAFCHWKNGNGSGRPITDANEQILWVTPTREKWHK